MKLNDTQKIVMHKCIEKTLNSNFTTMFLKNEEINPFKKMARTLWKKAFEKHKSKAVANKAVQSFFDNFI